MAKRCELTGTDAQSGNNVSHSHRKTRRRFEPNLHNVSLRSTALGRYLKLKITAATLRTVDHNGGLDNFLLSTRSAKLTATALKIKKQVKKVLGDKLVKEPAKKREKDISKRQAKIATAKKTAKKA